MTRRDLDFRSRRRRERMLDNGHISKYSRTDWKIDRPSIWRGLSDLPPRDGPVCDERTGRPITLPKLKFLEPG